MAALVPARRLASSLAELFPVTDAGPIEQLLVEYEAMRDTMERIGDIFGSEHSRHAFEYFIDANASHHVGVDHLFKLKPALKVLDAKFWDRALQATDVLSIMPAKRREEWRKQIDKRDVPEFTKDAIATTLAEHLALRPKYFAERVDGLFQALSPEHKTNLPSGFRSKLILSYVTDGWGDGTNRVDYIVDLRCVVGKFMGREDFGDGNRHVHCLTRDLVKYARREHRGEWVEIDGGAIGIKLHKSGTCHVRVHEELAWRLNGVLASVHPGAIPESARTRPHRGKGPKKAATIELMERPLPFAVVHVLSDFEAVRAEPGVWRHTYTWKDIDKHVRAEVHRVLESIGGVLVDESYSCDYRFDYDATPVIDEVVAMGVVPDQKAHQFYPTPDFLAERVVALAEIGPGDVVLEPSAGQGAIAELLPKDRTTCIEASSLHCAVLRAKGFSVLHGDWLQFGQRAFDELGVTRVVMNPPFDRGQWKHHVMHAAELLGGAVGHRLREDAQGHLQWVYDTDKAHAGAVLVAVLPASAVGSIDLMGFTVSWSEPIDGAFAGTTISVVIMKAVKKAD